MNQAFFIKFISILFLSFIISCGGGGSSSGGSEGDVDSSGIVCDGSITNSEWGFSIVSESDADESAMNENISDICMFIQNGYLYGAVKVKQYDNYESQVFLCIDTDSSPDTGIKNLETGTSFVWGVKGTTTSDFGWDYIVCAYGNEAGYDVFQFADDTSAGTSVKSKFTYGMSTSGDDKGSFEFKVKLSDIGLTESDSIKLMAFSTNSWATVENTVYDKWQVFDVCPDQATAASGATDQSITVANVVPVTLSEITFDGAIGSSEWGAAIVSESDADESALNENISDIYMFTRNGYLYGAVKVKQYDNWESQVFLCIDTDSSPDTGIKNLETATSFVWGVKGTTTSDFGWDYIVCAYGNEAGYDVFQFADDTSAGTSVKSKFTYGMSTSGDDKGSFEFKVKLSDIGLTEGDTIKLMAFSTNSWATVANTVYDKWQVFDVCPDQATEASGATDQSITVTNAIPFTIPL